MVTLTPPKIAIEAAGNMSSRDQHTHGVVLKIGARHARQGTFA